MWHSKMKFNLFNLKSYLFEIILRWSNSPLNRLNTSEYVEVFPFFPYSFGSRFKSFGEV